MNDPIPPPPGAPPPVPPPPEEVPHDLSQRVEGVSCPNCGGGLEVDTGRRVIECPYCETPFLVLSEPGVRRFSVKPQIDAEGARRITREWLGRGIAKDPRLKKEARLAEAFLCFLPFFRVEADAVGFALGTEKRRRTVGSGKNRRTETYEVDVERRVQQSFDRTYPAVEVAEWGIQRVDLRGDPLVLFDARALADQGMVFPPTGSERDVLAAALESFKSTAEPTSGLSRVRFRFFETLRERLSVIYYPLWVVRYHFRQRSYQVLVDGEDGSLSYGKAPGNDLFRALALVATEAGVIYLVTTALQLVGFNFPAFLFMSGLGFAILWWGWRRFRHGGVVIEGTGAARPDTLGRILQSAAGGRRARG